MLFQVVHPLVMTIDGDSVKSAIKNFIKLKHGLNLSKIILADQNNYYEAVFDYYNHQGRDKVGIDYYPASSAIITSLGLPLVPTISTIGVPTANIISPRGPIVGPGFDIGPTVGQVITPVASVVSPVIAPTRPIITDGNGLVATANSVGVVSGSGANVSSLAPIDGLDALSLLSPMSPIASLGGFAPVIVNL